MTPARYVTTGELVHVIQDGEELAYVKFPGGKVLWVPASKLDFDDLVGDDEFDFNEMMEHRLNNEHLDAEGYCYDDFEDGADYYDFEYDR